MSPTHWPELSSLASLFGVAADDRCDNSERRALADPETSQAYWRQTGANGPTRPERPAVAHRANDFFAPASGFEPLSLLGYLAPAIDARTALTMRDGTKQRLTAKRVPGGAFDECFSPAPRAIALHSFAMHDGD